MCAVLAVNFSKYPTEREQARGALAKKHRADVTRDMASAAGDGDGGGVEAIVESSDNAERIHLVDMHGRDVGGLLWDDDSESSGSEDSDDEEEYKDRWSPRPSVPLIHTNALHTPASPPPPTRGRGPARDATVFVSPLSQYEADADAVATVPLSVLEPRGGDETSLDGSRSSPSPPCRSTPMRSVTGATCGHGCAAEHRVNQLSASVRHLERRLDHLEKYVTLYSALGPDVRHSCLCGDCARSRGGQGGGATGAPAGAVAAAAVDDECGTHGARQRCAVSHDVMCGKVAYDELVHRVATDFRRSFFATWKEEIAQQRPSVRSHSCGPNVVSYEQLAWRDAIDQRITALRDHLDAVHTDAVERMRRLEVTLARALAELAEQRNQSPPVASAGVFLTDPMASTPSPTSPPLLPTSLARPVPQRNAHSE